MKRFLASLLFVCAVGCGGSQPSSPSADGNAQPGQAPLAVLMGKPSSDEAVSSIRAFFSQPGVGFSNVHIEKLSEPVEAPPGTVPGSDEVWVYSVTMNCNNVIGDWQQNKNWLVLMNRENGRPTVKDYYHNLERVQFSPLGKDWFARKGFADPVVVHND